jgi:hypothetical protein
LEVDGSNWVIFKDRFAFAAAAAGLEKHIDGTRSAQLLYKQNIRRVLTLNSSSLI